MDDLVESILDYIRSDYTDYAIMINGILDQIIQIMLL